MTVYVVMVYVAVSLLYILYHCIWTKLDYVMLHVRATKISEVMQKCRLKVFIKGILLIAIFKWCLLGTVLF